MKTILGLDLGVASIGWAIIYEDYETQKLLNTGVRIIPLDSTTVSDYSKGAATSKNQVRRLARAARRNNQRYKLRKHYLNEFLKKNEFDEIPKNLFELNAIQLYELRDKAITEKIPLDALTRIWFHLNQKRGYIDSRKVISEDSKDTKYVEKIKDTSKNIYSKYKTVGSYFYHQLKNNSIYRIKSGDDKENIFLIDDYRHEFDLIWEEQKKHYPHLLTEKNFLELRNKIIYYKRPLKSQKHLIGDCTFEKGHKAMPISSPIAVEIRIWQDINKVTITSKENEKYLLTQNQVCEIFNYLKINEKITEKQLLTICNFSTVKGEYKVNIEKDIKGNLLYTKLKKAFENNDVSFSAFESFNALDANFYKHPYFKLWHLLYATEEIKDIKNILLTNEKYYYPEALINDIVNIKIQNDFAALSSRAARKILPFLRQGKIFSEACNDAGYNHSQSITTEENEARPLITIKELELIKPNKLKNPTVEKILNQLINLLKALNNDGYEFDEIRIELARDLKKNAKERKNIDLRNRDNEKFTNTCIADLQKEGYGNPTKKEIEKYKLWLEFKGVSPYEPQTQIKLSDLFDKAKYEIEHIIPKSRLFDDSFGNKTIARTAINKEKNNITALDYMSNKTEEVLNQYIECIKRANISETKKKLLNTTGKDISTEFITRQLNETRYIAKETLSLLKKVCRNVYSTTGSITDYLRHQWGYDKILMDLNFSRVLPEQIITKVVEGKNITVIDGWTKRLDHRHHAIDAIVIACSKYSYIHQLNKLNSFFEAPTNIKAIPIKTKIPFSYQQVKTAIDNILISFKAGKKVASKIMVKKDRWGKEPKNIGQVMFVPRGALHEETIYGKNFTYTIIEIAKLDTIEKIAHTWQKKLLIDYCENLTLSWENAKLQLKKNPIKTTTGKILSKVTILDGEHTKTRKLQYNTQNKFDLKAAEKIVNKNVKELVITRLKSYGDDPSKAFKNLKDEPLFFNKEKGIVINSVKVFTGGTNYDALHDTANGKTLNLKQAKNVLNKKPTDYIIGGNNHHIAIYKDEAGKRYEECVSFFEAFERKAHNIPVINKIHNLGYKFITSLQQNEMFVFNLKMEELELAIKENNYSLISKYLYRVQKIASNYYVFRHHLETKSDDTKDSIELKKMIRIQTPIGMNGIKVEITKTNKIKIIQ